jgi:hypothetical protein
VGERRGGAGALQRRLRLASPSELTEAKQLRATDGDDKDEGAEAEQ